MLAILRTVYTGPSNSAYFLAYRQAKIVVLSCKCHCIGVAFMRGSRGLRPPDVGMAIRLQHQQTFLPRATSAYSLSQY